MTTKKIDDTYLFAKMLTEANALGLFANDMKRLDLCDVMDVSPSQLSDILRYAEEVCKEAEPPKYPLDYWTAEYDDASILEGWALVKIGGRFSVCPRPTVVKGNRVFDAGNHAKAHIRVCAEQGSTMHRVANWLLGCDPNEPLTELPPIEEWKAKERAKNDPPLPLDYWTPELAKQAVSEGWNVLANGAGIIRIAHNNNRGTIHASDVAARAHVRLHAEENEGRIYRLALWLHGRKADEPCEAPPKDLFVNMETASLTESLKGRDQIICLGRCDGEIRLRTSPKGSGVISSTLKESCEFCGESDCYLVCGRSVVAYEKSDDQTAIEDETTSRRIWNAQMDTLESMILACACDGIDVSSPAFQEAVQTTLDKLSNQES